MQLIPQHLAALERIASSGFAVVAFPLYANAVGVRKGEYAALLDPAADGSFRLFGEPCMLLEGNLTVRIADKGRSWFVWKKQRIEATPERLQQLREFVDSIKVLLEPRA